MPKRTDISTILIIGAGPIIIGQACEFDYSGTQACKTLRAEGYRIVLVNSNPATIMTDPDMADRTYVEPITPEVVAKIIEKERYAAPGGFALLPTMGGQTALNCALSLKKMGVLEKFDVEMIGATAEAIDKAEDRELFREAMHKIGLETPRSALANASALSQSQDRGAFCNTTSQLFATALGGRVSLASFVVEAPTPEAMPRMAIELVSPSEEGPKFRPGVKRATSSIDLMPWASMRPWVKALMLNGMRSRDSCRRVAVTTISLRSCASAPAPAVCA